MRRRGGARPELRRASSHHLARVVGGCPGKAVGKPEGSSEMRAVGARAHAPPSRRPLTAPAPGYHLAAIDSSRGGTRGSGARPA